MEDSYYLSPEDKATLEALKKELNALKAEHKSFAGKKSKLTQEERERWKANSTRMNEVYIALKEMRLKNILEAGK
jgi:uncharacterized protein YukE